MLRNQNEAREHRDEGPSSSLIPLLTTHVTLNKVFLAKPVSEGNNSTCLKGLLESEIMHLKCLLSGPDTHQRLLLTWILLGNLL